MMPLRWTFHVPVEPASAVTRTPGRRALSSQSRVGRDPGRGRRSASAALAEPRLRSTTCRHASQALALRIPQRTARRATSGPRACRQRGPPQRHEARPRRHPPQPGRHRPGRSEMGGEDRSGIADHPPHFGVARARPGGGEVDQALLGPTPPESSGGRPPAHVQGPEARRRSITHTRSGSRWSHVKCEDHLTLSRYTFSFLPREHVLRPTPFRSSGPPGEEARE